MSVEAEKKGKPIGKAAMLEVATVDELRKLGWRAEQGDTGWSAFEINGDRKVGHASSIAALSTQVKLAAGPPVTHQMSDLTVVDDEPRRPKILKAAQPILPNTKDAVLEDLRSAVLTYRATTMKILELQADQKEQKKSVMGLMHKFEDELSIDPESGNKYFQAEMVIAELAVEIKEELKTRAANA
jgi:hypothetical protein